MSFVVRPLGGDAPPRDEPPAPPAAPVVDLDPHALPSWRKSKGGPGLLRAAPVTCAIVATALALSLAVNVLVGHWSEYPERTVRATTVAFGGYCEDGLRNGDWERLFLAPLLHPDPLLTLFWGLMIAAAGVSVERRLGSWRYGVLLGSAAPIAIAAGLLRGDAFFHDRDPTVGLYGLYGALVGARTAVARRFPRSIRFATVDTATSLWPLSIILGLPLASILSAALVGWAFGRAFLKSVGVETAGPAGPAVKLAATGLLGVWLAAASSTSVGLADRLAASVPLDRVERFLSRLWREGDRSYRNPGWELPAVLRPETAGRLEESSANVRSDEERRLTALLWHAVRFDREADARKPSRAAVVRGTGDVDEVVRSERDRKWRAFYDACRSNWARLRLRRG